MPNDRRLVTGEPNDQEFRLLAMIDPQCGIEWELNAGDRAAIAWALAELERYRRTLWGMVHCAKYAGDRTDLCSTPTWAAVKHLTGEGATMSTRLCVEFGVDPDELTNPPHGDDEVEEEEDDDDVWSEWSDDLNDDV